MLMMKVHNPFDDKWYSLHGTKIEDAGWEVCLMDSEGVEILECVAVLDMQDLEDEIPDLLDRNLTGRTNDES